MKNFINFIIFIGLVSHCFAGGVLQKNCSLKNYSAKTTRFILDSILGANVAYANRQLISSYVNADYPGCPIMRAWRISTTAETNIPSLTSGALNISYLTNFLNGQGAYGKFFDQISGNTAYNTQITPPLRADSVGKYGLYFNGGTYCYSPNRAALQYTTAMTLIYTFRKNVDATTAEFLFSKHVEGTSGYEAHFVAGTAGTSTLIYLIHSPPTYYYSNYNNIIPTGQKVQLAFIFDGSSTPHKKLYKNGVFQTPTTSNVPPASIPADTTPLYFGSRAPGNYAAQQLYIYNFIGFNRVLTDAEIAAIYADEVEKEGA